MRGGTGWVIGSFRRRSTGISTPRGRRRRMRWLGPPLVTQTYGSASSPSPPPPQGDSRGVTIDEVGRGFEGRARVGCGDGDAQGAGEAGDRLAVDRGEQVARALGRDPSRYLTDPLS